jgi:DNA ligase-1
MQLARLVEAVEHVRATAKKSEKVRILADTLRATHGHETVLAAQYLSGSLPQGKIGVGWHLIQKAIEDVPFSGEPLNLGDVDQAFAVLTTERGVGSTERRTTELSRLFTRARPEERRFLSQLLIGELRQGALEGVLLDAIAVASGLPAADVRQAFMFAPSLGDLASAALTEGAAGLARYSLRLFRPVAPMLASTAEDIDAALDRLGSAAFEYKLDGARIQVHKGGDEVRLFTRQLQDVTGRLPEVVEWARRLPVEVIVLDGEAIALRADGRPQPFQITMRRLGRMKDVAAMRESIPLSPFMFDALYVDGDSLLPVRTKNVRVSWRRSRLRQPSRVWSRLNGMKPEAFWLNPSPPATKESWPNRLKRPTLRGSVGFTGSSSRKRPRSIWSFWRRSGETAGGKAGSRICISVPAIPRAANSSCSARPSKD